MHLVIHPALERLWMALLHPAQNRLNREDSFVNTNPMPIESVRCINGCAAPTERI